MAREEYSIEYTRVPIAQFPRLALRETSEDRYWKQLKHPIISKEFGPVTSIHFAPTAPHHYAVTTGTQVQIYDSATNKPKKTLARFKHTASSGWFRQDGRLLVAGDHGGSVRVFDVNARMPLRTFEGHKKPVHMTRFLFDASKVISGGEDQIVKLWDMGTEAELLAFEGHKDTVHSAAALRHDSTFITASYDHTAKLWDAREGAATLSVDHGAPIESTVALNNSAAFITAGGNTVKVWDLVAGGKLLAEFSNHQKTITEICLDSAQRRLFSCGLDRLVKVYDISTWNVVHSFKYSAQLLSMAVAPGDTHLAVGTSVGMLDVRTRVHKAPGTGASGAGSGAGSASSSRSGGATSSSSSKYIRKGTYKFFMRGQTHKPSAIDYQVEVAKRKKLKPYDKHLRAFRYADALDAVLTRNTRPVVVASVIQELVRRDGLMIAISGRNEDSLRPLLSFIVANINNPRYSTLLSAVGELVLDVYSQEISQSATISSLCCALSRKLKAELTLQEQLQRTMGSLDAILAAGIA
eukprot:m.25559 g.25559  ORF g.25559 m.25559 type:complete len:523 (-) comp8732_c2_seq1:55-1623(-)